MIKAIVFDFCGVLVFPANFDKFACDFSKESGISAAMIHKTLHMHWQPWKIGKMDYDEFLTLFLKDLNLPFKFKRWILDYFKSYYSLNNSLFELVLKLKNNYKLYVLSNQVDDLFSHFSMKHNFKEFFDDQFISDDCGCAKPDHIFFNLFLDRTGFKANECLFVDNQLNNIQSANKLGFNVIHYRNLSDFKKQLKTLLL